YLWPMKLLDGQLVSEKLLEELQEKNASRVAGGARPPHLAAILVGENPASQTYVGAKVRACARLGFRSTLLRLGADISEADLLGQIRRLNEDPAVDGILVQLPLPPGIREGRIIDAIDPSKDVDGFHATNAGRMVQGQPGFLPATPHGILLMLGH